MRISHIKNSIKETLRRETQYNKPGWIDSYTNFAQTFILHYYIKYKLQDQRKLILESQMKIIYLLEILAILLTLLFHCFIKTAPYSGHKMAVHFAFSADESPVILTHPGYRLVGLNLYCPWKFPHEYFPSISVDAR